MGDSGWVTVRWTCNVCHSDKQIGSLVGSGYDFAAAERVALAKGYRKKAGAWTCPECQEKQQDEDYGGAWRAWAYEWITPPLGTRLCHECQGLLPADHWFWRWFEAKGQASHVAICDPCWRADKTSPPRRRAKEKEVPKERVECSTVGCAAWMESYGDDHTAAHHDWVRKAGWREVLCRVDSTTVTHKWFCGSCVAKRKEKEVTDEWTDERGRKWRVCRCGSECCRPCAFCGVRITAKRHYETPDGSDYTCQACAEKHGQRDGNDEFACGLCGGYLSSREAARMGLAGLTCDRCLERIGEKEPEMAAEWRITVVDTGDEDAEPKVERHVVAKIDATTYENVEVASRVGDRLADKKGVTPKRTKVILEGPLG